MKHTLEAPLEQVVEEVHRVSPQCSARCEGVMGEGSPRPRLLEPAGGRGGAGPFCRDPSGTCSGGGPLARRPE